MAHEIDERNPINFNSSMLRANAVLALINLEGILDSDHASVQAYSNGREQGYYIFLVCQNCNFYGIAFSENRNSDDVVVYSGPTSEFDMAGHVPSNEIFKKAKYYPSVERAAYAIVKLIDDYQLVARSNKAICLKEKGEQND